MEFGLVLDFTHRFVNSNPSSDKHSSRDIAKSIQCLCTELASYRILNHAAGYMAVLISQALTASCGHIEGGKGEGGKGGKGGGRKLVNVGISEASCYAKGNRKSRKLEKSIHWCSKHIVDILN